MRRVSWLVVAACVIAPAAGPWTGARAQEAEKDPETGWSNSTELSLVVTEGNSDTQTLGFKNDLRRRWSKALFSFKLGGINAENTTITRIAVGPDPLNFVVEESESTEKTAEQFYAEARYNRKIHERLFWFAGARWEANRPAGIDSRSLVFGGVGNIWYDKEKIKFTTDYSVTYTDQQDVVQVPGVDRSFAGARFTSLYDHKLTKTTTFTNEFTLDADLEETSNYRGNMINSVSVSISEKLALKASLQWLYENDPALEEILLFDMVGGTQIGTVFVPVEKLDTIFTTSLVINF